MRLFGAFIGIDQYGDRRISALNWAAADAEAFYALVSDGLQPRNRQLFLLKNQEATKISILKTVGEDIARLAAHDDVILLFFAGHGSPETEGSPDRASRYLIAYDTEYDNVYATGLDLESELRRLLERLRAKLVVFIIDACFSGRAGGRTFEGPRLREARSKFRTIVALKKLDVGEGRLILAGADDEEVAREDDRLRHGVFTHFLIETFTEDSLTRELIGVGELYEAVAHKVQTYTSGQQNPVLNGRSRLAALPAFKRQNH